MGSSAFFCTKADWCPDAKVGSFNICEKLITTINNQYEECVMKSNLQNQFALNILSKPIEYDPIGSYFFLVNQNTQHTQGENP